MNLVIPVCDCRRLSQEDAKCHPDDQRVAYEESAGIELRCNKQTDNTDPHDDPRDSQ